jgi:hypothetical protein
MSRLKLTTEEYNFFAEHAPKDYDLSALKLVPKKDSSLIVTVNKKAFIDLAGKTDHLYSGSMMASIEKEKLKDIKEMKAMSVFIPATVVAIVAVLAVIVNLIGS